MKTNSKTKKTIRVKKEQAVALCEVVDFLDTITGSKDFPDFPAARNGLQFENSGGVARIACAVDAGLAEIKAAENIGADLLIVHHGMFWSDIVPFVGANYEKVRALVDGGIAVYSCHLPLDAHPQFGNNVLIAKALNLKVSGSCFPYEENDLGVLAEVPKEGRRELSGRLAKLFPDTFKAIEFGSDFPSKVAICSGSCGDVVPELAKAGTDTLVCGELRQRHFSMAQELGLNLYPCGHYATETFGVMALAELAANRFGLKCDFIEMRNPL